MSILTGRELEFLDSLRTSWPRLYWNELARLRKEDKERREAQPAPRATKRHRSRPGGKILVFTPRHPRNITPE
jgi:hypothetical protein